MCAYVIKINTKVHVCICVCCVPADMCLRICVRVRACDMQRGIQVCYTTTDGIMLASHVHAKKYLADKQMDAEDEEEILSSLKWNDDRDSPETFARKYIQSSPKRQSLRSRAPESPEVPDA